MVMVAAQTTTAHAVRLGKSCLKALDIRLSATMSSGSGKMRAASKQEWIRYRDYNTNPCRMV